MGAGRNRSWWGGWMGILSRNERRRDGMGGWF